MKRALVLVAGLLSLGLTPVHADEAPAAQPAPALRKRYNPGLAVWLVGEGRSYESLDGTATALGLGVGYSLDLASIHAEYLQSVVGVAGHKPKDLKLALEYAFFTLGGFSGLGRLGGVIKLDPPACQLAPYARSGPDCVVGREAGPLAGPELGLGFRYRVMPKLDVFLNGTADLEIAVNGSRRWFFNPGVGGGVVVHPFGSED